jgi:hybrid cluster-associated redox disulfide protein
MPDPEITLDTSIAEIMQTWPETIQVFINHGMICVGCHMSAFDTLADAITNYGYSVDIFVQKLNEAISETRESTKNHYD